MDAQSLTLLAPRGPLTDGSGACTGANSDANTIIANGGSVSHN